MDKVVVKKEYAFPVGGIVFVVLFILKLMGEIDMHWFWVLTSWIWVPVLLLLSAVALVLGFAAIIAVIGAIASR